jgi:hypothetical protein
VLFINSPNGTNKDIKVLVIYGFLGTVFFASGIGLIRTKKDEA